MDGPLDRRPDGLRVRVRLTPNAGRAGVRGLKADAAGVCRVDATVTAAPEEGKANAALVKLLARQWGVAKSDLSVVSGTTDRNKVLMVAGDPDALWDRLNRWVAGLEQA